MRTTTLFLLVLPIIITSCQSSNNPSPDLKAEEAALLKTDSGWSALAKEGADPEKILAYWTDDAVVVAPGQPIVKGKAALRKMVTDSKNIPGFSISWKSSDVQLSPDGDMAYMYGENLMTMNDSTGKKISIPGRGYTIWRKQADGAWKCAVDIWNNPSQ